MTTQAGLHPPSMHTFPSSSADDAAWKDWCSSHRPTTHIPVSIQDVDLPLRVVSREALLDPGSYGMGIKTVKPEDWNFAAISHRWLTNTEWTAVDKRPYLAAGAMTVWAVKRHPSWPWQISSCPLTSSISGLTVCVSIKIPTSSKPVRFSTWGNTIRGRPGRWSSRMA